ncbi:MAG: hypothetical protein AB7O45_13105 [Alphaproteobacteria bacterium]
MPAMSQFQPLPSPDHDHAAWWAAWRAVYDNLPPRVLPTRDETAVRPDVERALGCAMRDLQRDHGAATWPLLRQLGFTTAELTRHGEAAGALARRLRAAEEGGARARPVRRRAA